jgi:hypothetical protein
MQLTEELINSFSSKEYKQYRKEIKEFYRLKRRDNYIDVEYMPNNLLTDHEKGQKDYLKSKEEKPWYGSYMGTRQRCNNPKNEAYKYYGGRGIKSFLTEKEVEFLWHRDSAINMTKPSIDRINNNGNYELNNCCFIELEINVKKGNKLLLKYDKNYVNLEQIFQYRTYFIHVWQIKNDTYFTFETKNDRISCSSSSQ